MSSCPSRPCLDLGLHMASGVSQAPESCVSLIVSRGVWSLLKGLFEVLLASCLIHKTSTRTPRRMGNVSETPTPTPCIKSTAVHLQFVRQYAPHLYRRTFLASKLRRKGNPAIRLPFVLQYASHLYGRTAPICTAVLFEKYWGLGSPKHKETSKKRRGREAPSV